METFVQRGGEFVQAGRRQFGVAQRMGGQCGLGRAQAADVQVVDLAHVEQGSQRAVGGRRVSDVAPQVSKSASTSPRLCAASAINATEFAASGGEQARDGRPEGGIVVRNWAGRDI